MLENDLIFHAVVFIKLRVILKENGGEFWWEKLRTKEKRRSKGSMFDPSKHECCEVCFQFEDSNSSVFLSVDVGLPD